MSAEVKVTGGLGSEQGVGGVCRVPVEELRARRAHATVVENDAQGRVTPEWVLNLAVRSR